MSVVRIRCCRSALYFYHFSFSAQKFYHCFSCFLADFYIVRFYYGFIICRHITVYTYYGYSRFLQPFESRYHRLFFYRIDHENVNACCNIIIDQGALRNRVSVSVSDHIVHVWKIFLQCFFRHNFRSTAVWKTHRRNDHAHRSLIFIKRSFRHECLCRIRTAIDTKIDCFPITVSPPSAERLTGDCTVCTHDRKNNAANTAAAMITALFTDPSTLPSCVVSIP